ncbi:four-carbon acid sugar kinase family protein [Agilicoccus flavus]|uniref:four-carbon acid sugar kinase family protein n=1 Tax=Agilicoccus flavus TaxID=2775968 RepID=UPI001CF634AF|nr:four-carbon acid sugar kinase family protein [Agilicoccus flavus]
MPQTRETLLAGRPTGPAVDPAEIAAGVDGSRRVFVVLDDDPTGTQSVTDLPVLMSWSVESLEWALSQGRPAVYVMTNSRSLDPADARQRNVEVARAAFEAAAKVGVDVDFVSRSDSTLRGHFPLETDTLAAEIEAATGRGVDGVVVVPAFGDAGRITVGGVHYAGSDAAGFVPVGESEFATDATFGYCSSAMTDWVAEKTGGRVAAQDVAFVDLTTLRTDPEATVAALTSLRDGRPFVVDIVEENDLLLLSAALERAESTGVRLLYRVGPPFMRARLGQTPRTPLTGGEVRAIRVDGVAEDSVGGLIMIGSHTALTTSQLEALRARSAPTEFEIDVATVRDAVAREAHLAQIVADAVAALASGNVAVRTSRTLVKGADADDSLAIARLVSSAVVEVTQRILAAYPPRFVVAKGGITSSDVASRGLSIDRAYVRGPMLPGIVSLWEPMDGPARGIPYIVFAGNVGGPESLADVVDTLSA